MASILVAHRDPHRTDIELILEGAGHEVVSVDDGLQAIAAAGRAPVHLVVTAITLPEESGLAVITRLRSLYEGLSFIAIADETEPQCNLNAARAFGATQVLRTPVQPQMLLACVEDLLGAK